MNVARGSNGVLAFSITKEIFTKAQGTVAKFVEKVLQRSQT